MNMTPIIALDLTISMSSYNQLIMALEAQRLLKARLIKNNSLEPLRLARVKLELNAIIELQTTIKENR